MVISIIWGPSAGVSSIDGIRFNDEKTCLETAVKIKQEVGRYFSNHERNMVQTWCVFDPSVFEKTK